MLFNSRFSDKAAAAKQKTEVFAALGIESQFGGVPWPLPNMKETTEAAFWSFQTSYSFRADIHVLSMKFDTKWGDVFIYWVGHGRHIDGGFAVRVLRNGWPESASIQYFEWRACDHDFSSRTIGNCLTKYTCRKCGKSYDVDSSG